MTQEEITALRSNLKEIIKKEKSIKIIDKDDIFFHNQVGSIREVTLTKVGVKNVTVFCSVTKKELTIKIEDLEIVDNDTPITFQLEKTLDFILNKTIKEKKIIRILCKNSSYGNEIVRETLPIEIKDHWLITGVRDDYKLKEIKIIGEDYIKLSDSTKLKFIELAIKNNQNLAVVVLDKNKKMLNVSDISPRKINNGQLHYVVYEKTNHEGGIDVYEYFKNNHEMIEYYEKNKNVAVILCDDGQIYDGLFFKNKPKNEQIIALEDFDIIDTEHDLAYQNFLRGSIKKQIEKQVDKFAKKVEKEITKIEKEKSKVEKNNNKRDTNKTKYEDEKSKKRVIKIIYHGGSNPGSIREVLPQEIRGEYLHAVCMIDHVRKSFKINLIECYNEETGEVTPFIPSVIGEMIIEGVNRDIPMPKAETIRKEITITPHESKVIKNKFIKDENAKFRYFGGSQPGRVREILVYSQRGDYLKGYCYSSRMDKTYKIDLVERVSDDTPIDYIPEKIKGGCFGCLIPIISLPIVLFLFLLL